MRVIDPGNQYWGVSTGGVGMPWDKTLSRVPRWFALSATLVAIGLALLMLADCVRDLGQ